MFGLFFSSLLVRCFSHKLHPRMLRYLYSMPDILPRGKIRMTNQNDAGELGLIIIGVWFAIFVYGIMCFGTGDNMQGGVLLSIDFGIPLVASIWWCVASSMRGQLPPPNNLLLLIPWMLNLPCTPPLRRLGCSCWSTQGNLEKNEFIQNQLPTPFHSACKHAQLLPCFP